ncbi:hypothetical protein SUDANB95_04691 [Actinosynnema sp. ALI-1.44]
MCNPRRVRVRATRVISEQWRTEVVRTARAAGTVAGEATLTRSLRTLLARPLLVAFERALAEDPEWELVDGDYHHRVPDGLVVYRPATGDLEISVRLTAAVEVEGSATRVESGEVTDEVETEQEGLWYEDEWMGRTRQKAEEEAGRAAERIADELAERRREALRREAEQQARLRREHGTSAAEADARADADRKLDEESRLRERELRSAAQQRLEEVHERTMRGVQRAMVAGVQGAITEFAHRNGAQNFVVREEDGVVEIQFEMES